MNRHQRRRQDAIARRATPTSSVIQQADAASSEEHHPNPGDTVLGCTHRPDLTSGAHYYFIKGGSGIQFWRPDGAMGFASWVILCGACMLKYGSDVHGSIERQELPLGADMTWPEGLKVEFKKN